MAGTGGGGALFHCGLEALELLLALFAPMKMLFTRVRIRDLGRDTLPGAGNLPLSFRRKRKSVRIEPFSSSGMGSDMPTIAPPEDRRVFWAIISSCDWRDCRRQSMMIAAARAPATAPGKKPATTAVAGNFWHVVPVCVCVELDVLVVMTLEEEEEDEEEEEEEDDEVAVAGDESLMDIVVVAVAEVTAESDMDAAPDVAVDDAPEAEEVEFASDEVATSSTHVVLSAHE